MRQTDLKRVPAADACWSCSRLPLRAQFIGVDCAPALAAAPVEALSSVGLPE
jgi:hypothetical protein